ncbi:MULTISPECIES: TonB-dependent siderophore receptor [unclassified Janthinobacterium]|uniref:TonB-dependent receptor plug domain-containing protein n=1 Tax=unclassified Janthinobacterium TaxID=2610881 RepID=UPI00161D1A4D|nr:MULTISPECIES: TonB-dependent receptor [unclassified Janthinobacterium]MBB5369206.1 outer membrane receptor protein involved in Fe transport [Janthinobacterium sp. K2C7]MBB5381257.1 outer membrane receptor protein involved in Fe transport [Janthinobacterium sp. K2Li3]MBB5387589.1 outer membrane receptor protein involved in Fe transport [Janthinobacterium sp. K2E3]
MRLNVFLCSLALPLTAHAYTDDAIPDTTVPSVTVNAGKLQQRRNDTVASIVVGYEELNQQGDRSLSDALKRLPGISIGGAQGSGQGGQIQLRGLGQGYTLIMLNGVPVPAGFSLDSLDPELVERVEIMRATTAEFSAQAIAGSINIILKKVSRKPERTFKLGASHSNGMPAGSATMQLSDKAGSLSYVLAGTLSHTGRQSLLDEWDREYRVDGTPTVIRHLPLTERVTSDALELAPRLQWALEGEDSLSLQNLFSFRRLASARHVVETAYLGGNTEYPDNDAYFNQDSSIVRSDLHWLRKLDHGASLDLKLGLNYNHRSSNYTFNGAGFGTSTTRLVDSGVDDTGVSISGTYRRSLGEHHTLAAGWEAERRRRAEFRRERQLVPDSPPVLYDADYAATVRRLALFAQDEWEISSRWSLYLGLRWESLRTASATGDGPAVDVRSQVWSPVLQSLWKLRSQDQLRLALTRTYKAPQIFQLIPRPYTIDNGNSPTNPDTQGNPALRPELAWGLDAAYEYYLGEGAMLSASATMRRISDVMMDRLYQDNGRWVSSPYNNGTALARGIELEAKLPLTVLFASAPKLDLRANLARNWSRVDAVPGPDNRLDSQLPWSANLGADYQLTGLPLTVGGNLNYQAGGASRDTRELWSYQGTKRELDLYGLWKFSDKLRLRLSGANLLAQKFPTRSLYADNTGSILRTVDTATHRTVRLMLEGSL